MRLPVKFTAKLLRYPYQQLQIFKLIDRRLQGSAASSSSDPTASSAPAGASSAGPSDLRRLYPLSWEKLTRVDLSLVCGYDPRNTAAQVSPYPYPDIPEFMRARFSRVGCFFIELEKLLTALRTQALGLTALSLELSESTTFPAAIRR